MAENDSTLKRCPRCQSLKSHAIFYNSAKSKDGKAGYCIPCTKEKVIEWQKANPDKKAASDKKQNKKPERILKSKVRKKKYFDENREKELKKLSEWGKLNPEKRAASLKIWKDSNKEKVASAQKRYHDKPEWRAIAALRHQVTSAIKRAKSLNISNENCITRIQWQAVLKRFDYSCCYCGIKGKMTLEHLEPLTRGGGNFLGNIAPACNTCNRKKWSATLDEFAPEKAQLIRKMALLI